MAEYPDWEEHADTLDGGDFEVAVPAPAGSKAEHLVVFTNGGEDIWLRYSPPRMCYAVDDEDEMIKIIGQLLADEVCFLVIEEGDLWVETTLIRQGQIPSLEVGQVARVVSWSGSHDSNPVHP